MDSTPHVIKTSPFSLSNLAQWSVERFHLIILFVLPLLITLINPNWLYNLPRLNTIDTWVYNGLFRYFFDFADQYPSNIHYFVERVSWVLPGHFLYQIFSPIIANLILHLGVFYLAVFSLYGTARRLFGKDTAFITALCLGCYTWFLRAAGHDYVDGIGLAYFSAALWAATEAAYRQNFKKYLVISGVFLGLDLLSQLFLVVFLPIIGLYYLALNAKNHRHLIVTSILWWCVGGTILLSSFMTLNFLMVGEFNVFNDSLIFAMTGTSSPIMTDAILRDYGVTPSTWLALPCLLMIGAIFIFFRWKHIPQALQFPFRLVVMTFIMTMCVFIYFHHRSSYLHLIIYLYMSLMIPALFLLFAGLISITLPNITWRTGVKLLGISLIPFVASLMFSGLEGQLQNPYFVWIISGVVIVILLCALLLQMRPSWIVGSFAMMSLLFSGHNGMAIQDRLYSYKIFTATDYTLSVLDSLDPAPLDFSKYIVWQDTNLYSAYSSPIRGISQPIFNHGVNWSRNARSFETLNVLYQVQEDLVLLSDHPSTIPDIENTLDTLFDVEILHTFSLPDIDPTGQYRGYVMRLTRLDSYGKPIFPTGEQIHRATLLFEPSIRVAWTGPLSESRLRFNLPAPRSDVVLEVCGVLSTTDLSNTLIASLNEREITLTRQPAKAACDIHYRADIPSDFMRQDGFTELKLNIPTASASQVMQRNIQQLYGIALTSITFYEGGMR